MSFKMCDFAVYTCVLCVVLAVPVSHAPAATSQVAAFADSLSGTNDPCQNTRNHLHVGPHYKICLENQSFGLYSLHTERTYLIIIHYQ